MPTNLELKIEIESFSNFLKRLRKIGAKYQGVLLQKDVYYLTSAGLLKLRTENGKSSLIFYNREEKRKNRWSDFKILNIDGEDPEMFFNKFLKKEIIVEKKRKLFVYNNTRIHLDDVKNLGYFLELETLVIQGKRDSLNRFNELVHLLDLDLSMQIRKSYFNLLKEKRNKK